MTDDFDHWERLHREAAASAAAARDAAGVLSVEDAAELLAEAAGELAQAASLLAEEPWRDSPQASIAAMEAAIAAFRAAEAHVDAQRDVY